MKIKRVCALHVLQTLLYILFH